MGTLERIADLADLGELIKQRRVELGYTQQAAAELLGIGRRLLIELERGNRSVRIATVLKVLAAFGLEMQVGPRAAPGGAPSPASVERP